MRVAVRRATASDLDQASEVLGEAFAAYAWTAWTVDPDNHQHRITQLQRLAMELQGLPFGHVWVGVVGERIQSVAVWIDSTVSVLTSETERARSATAALEGCRHEASMAAEQELLDWRPRRRHYYLATVGTSPAMQRRGLAKLVMAPMLSAADDEGIPSFLETSAVANLAFYATLGFEIIGQRTIDGGGPEVWAMIRHR